MKMGPFEETARTIKYQNSWIASRKRNVIRPNGEKGIFGLVHMKPGSTVLALDARERVLLIRNTSTPSSAKRSNWSAAASTRTKIRARRR
jgi:hypothetical protein